jgi:hypothetical protein
MTAALERRARELRARAIIRSWEYRQRHHARGVWFTLRRVLADASAAFVISSEDSATLVAEGNRVEPVGQALDPPKVILFAPAERLARLASAREVTVRLSREVLEARHLALTPFERVP